MQKSGGLTESRVPAVFLGQGLAAYNFGPDHPFGPQRHRAFEQSFRVQGLDRRCQVRVPRVGTQAEIERFHSAAYVDRVRRLSRTGRGHLDYGDTPAFQGVYEAAATVVGTVLDALDGMLNRQWTGAFVPIGGLHHARRNGAAGFCVFNDCGVAVETLLHVYGLERVAYVDIDAHHGDGVFYAFEDEPRLIFADIHQDGRSLYPGTGAAHETGIGSARGTKLNIPLPPGSDDAAFLREWPEVESLLERYKPQFIILQCGADSLAGDPITGLHLSANAHRHAARRLRALSERCCRGRLLALGGGGYRLGNLAAAWTAVVEELARA